MMVDCEMVIEGLECCNRCDNEASKCECCPYAGTGMCDDNLMKDALTLLKAQKARIMTLDEVRAWNQPEIWLESKKPDILGNFITPMTRIEWAFFTSVVVDSSKNPPVTQIVNYGKEFRCWTSRPTDEQREATPWI